MSPRRRAAALVSALAVGVACSGGGSSRGGGDGGGGITPSGCSSSADCAVTNVCEPWRRRCEAPVLRFSGISPGSHFFSTGGDFTVRLEMDYWTGAIPAARVLVDEVVAGSGPLYEFVSVAGSEVEGDHVVIAEATFADRVIRSAPFTLTVDRTPPAVVALRPDPSQAELPDQDFVEIEFSEPIVRATLSDLDARADTGVVGWPMLSTDGRVVRLPTPNLRDLLEITVQLRAKDVAGNSGELVQVRWSQSPLVATLRAAAGPRDPYVRGDVALDVEVTGGTADAVELSISGAAGARLVTLPGPPYGYTFHSEEAAEGTTSFGVTALRGSRRFSGNWVTLATDRAAPTAMGFAPGGVVSAAPLRARERIVIPFSERLDPSTIGAASIRLTDGAGQVVPAMLSTSFSGDFVYVDPDPAAPVPDRLTVSLGASLTDLAGNPLVPASCTWDVPEWLPGATQPAAPGGSIVAAANLGGVVVWEEHDPANALARWVYAGGIGSYTGDRLYADPSAEAREPSATFDLRRTPAVAWTERAGDGTWQVHVKRYDASMRWWTLVGAGVGGGAEGDAREPAVGLDATAWDDAPVLAWTRQGSPASVEVRRWRSGAWGPVADAPPGGAGAHAPAVVVAPGGIPVLAWLEPDAGGADQLLVRRLGAAGWEPVEGPLNASAGASPPSLALDGAGHPVVAWSEPAPGGLVVQVARHDGAAWQRLVPLASDGADLSQPSLGIATSGAPVVAYVDGASGGRLVRVARWGGDAWIVLGAVNAELGGGRSPRLWLGTADTPSVVWTEDPGDLRTATYNR